MTENPLANQTVRRLFGLISGFVIALFSFLYLEGTLLLLGLVVAVLEALLVPYFLGLAVETDLAEPS